MNDINACGSTGDKQIDLSKIEKTTKEEMQIPDEIQAKIQKLVPEILTKQRNDEYEFLSTDNNLIFQLTKHPEFVFKMPLDVRRFFNGVEIGSAEITQIRFENMKKAREVCETHQLGLLVIPKATLLIVSANDRAYHLIVEEALPIVSSDGVQRKNYHKYSKELTPAIGQLATFIKKTGFNDVKPENIPMLGEHHIALIDLEIMDSVRNGFMGSINGSCGLIRCAPSEELIDVIIAEAGSAITPEDAENGKQSRLRELESEKKLRQFYDEKGIAGKEFLQVDVESLGLDLNEKGTFKERVGRREWVEKTVSLGDVVKEIISEINALIEKSSDREPIEKQRYLFLNTNEDPLFLYNELGLSKKDAYNMSDEERNKQLWIPRIINALIDKGHLFKLHKTASTGYFIQA